MKYVIAWAIAGVAFTIAFGRLCWKDASEADREQMARDAADEIAWNRHRSSWK